MLKLREIRERKGLKQTDIASILDVSQQAVSRYETEARQLTPDQIIKLSLALEVTPNELLGFKEAYDEYSKYLISLKDDDDEN